MDTVTVLMSTYNGEKYLKTQIDSILNQKGVNVNLMVRDDGSTDSTLTILEDYAIEGKLQWYSGENLRSARSFMNLLKMSDECEYYAFSDQDDYWLPNKLFEAVSILKKQPSNIPSLYYSGTILVDSDLNKIKQDVDKRIFTKFNNAVVSSNATGCTFCFNKQLRDLINIYEPSYQIMHDGWLHKVCLAVGGYVYYDKNSYIKYRQHSNNVIGGTTTPVKRWKRRVDTMKKNPRPRSRGIQEIINGYESLMPEENLKICRQVAEYNDSFSNRVRLLINKKIYSPNKRIDRMYRLAILLGLF